MIFYSWTALSESGSAAPGESGSAAPGESGSAAPDESGSAAPGESDRDALSDSDLIALSDSEPGAAGSPVAMGITDDRGRAMKAAEEALGSGQAVMVIIEAVRPAMAAHTLAPCYVRTGVGWLGRCTDAGQVAWKRFFP